MKHKKLIALLAASVMAMSSMTAFAAEGAIDGSVNYVDKTIFKVVLPTTEGMSFILDPQGLTSLDKTGTYDQGEAGKIVADGTMTAKNWSSVEVELTASFYVTDTNDTPVVLVGDSGISDSEANEMQLSIKDDDDTQDDIYVTGDAEGSATSITYAMDAADYEFIGNATDGYEYVLVEDATAAEVNMEITGAVASDADWSAYTGDAKKVITLNALFKFTDPNDSDAEIDEEFVVQDSVTPVLPTYSKASGGSITVDTSKSTVSAVKYGPAEDNIPNTTTYSFDADTHVVTLPSGLFAKLTAGASGYIEVTYGNGSTEVFEVTVAD